MSTPQTVPAASVLADVAGATNAPPAVLGGGAGGAPIVLGLDLSLTATGVAHATATHTIRTDARGLARLNEITNAVVGWAYLTPGVPADLVVLEGPSFASKGGLSHERAGLWWLVYAELAEHGIPVAIAPPANVKKYATGKGNATKPDMRMALFQRAQIDERDDNRCDAWWLRAMGLDHLGHPLVDLPKTNRDALLKVAWPTGDPS